MGKVLACALAMLLAGGASSAEQPRYSAMAGILLPESVSVLGQRFDDGPNEVRLEVYSNLRKGGARIVVLRPGGAIADDFEVKGDLIHCVERRYSAEKGEWRVEIRSSGGEGACIVKLHDGMRFEGMNRFDEKALGGDLVWELGEGR